MSYLSLYRKYRSQDFDDVLGQNHVTQTLKNALQAGTMAHAYLFTGPRGTGKTSTARVLAKALNCLSTPGPTPNPCGSCAACVRIRDGQSMDVLELDAASNRGIDEIRSLREGVKYTPAEERVKVYVIDEVHQLTPEAFNALLKTLEEPPQNVVFVLATTELHKVPGTIVSRCQRFDFRRGSLPELEGRIASVCSAEGIDISPEAVKSLALAANGGFRDALGLLEQVAAFSSQSASISLADVNGVLGNVSDERLLEVGDALAAGDTAACFRIVEETLGAGVEVREFLGGVRKHLRALLRIAIGVPDDEMDRGPDYLARQKEQARRLPQARLLWSLEQVNEAERDLRWTPQQRLLLELILVKLATGPMPVAAAEHALSRAQSPAREERRAAPAAPPAPTLKLVEGGFNTGDEEPPLEEPPPREQRSGGAPPHVQGAGASDSDIGADTEVEQLSLAWNRMMQGLPPNSSSRLRGMRISHVERGVVIVTGPEWSHVEHANSRRERIAASFEQATGKRMPLKFVCAEPEHSSAAEEPTLFAAEPAPRASTPRPA